MSVRSILVHRCVVKRSVLEQVNGYPVRRWGVITYDEPCLLDCGVVQRVDATATVEQQNESDRQGVVFALPGSVIRPADILEFTGVVSGRFEVTGSPSPVNVRHGSHHREIRVREVSA